MPPWFTTAVGGWFIVGSSLVSGMIYWALMGIHGRWKNNDDRRGWFVSGLVTFAIYGALILGEVMR